jgi:hypothetical protein
MVAGDDIQAAAERHCESVRCLSSAARASSTKQSMNERSYSLRARRQGGADHVGVHVASILVTPADVTGNAEPAIDISGNGCIPAVRID